MLFRKFRSFGMILLFAILLALAIPLKQVHAQTDYISNGSFESGTSGWTLQYTGFNPCCLTGYVQSFAMNDSAGHFGLPGIAGAPLGANYLASGFDGDGPSEFYLTQTVTLPAGTSTLSFAYSANIDYSLGVIATQGRVFNAEIVNPVTNGVISTIFSRTFGHGTTYHNVSWDNVSGSFSLAQCQTVQVRFRLEVFQDHSGPGQAAYDNIRLTSSGDLSECGQITVPVVEPQPIFFDGRINDFDTGNSVVLYGKSDAEDNWRLDVYNADESGLLLTVEADIINATLECPDSNTLIVSDAATGISLWRLPPRAISPDDVPICPFQLNAPATELGKTYVVIFDTLFPHTYYTSNDERFGQ